MKVLQALAEPQNATVSKRSVDLAAVKIWDYNDEFSGQDLRCGKCGGKIGRWHGPWSRLEGDHPNVGTRFAEHTCQNTDERHRQLRRDIAQYAIDLRLIHPELTRRQVKIARNKFYRYLLKDL